MERGTIQLLKTCFAERNIGFEYYKNSGGLICKVVEEASKVKSIGIGNSKTLKDLKIFETVSKHCQKVYDKTLAKTELEKTEIKRRALLSDLYITGSNAISKDGKIINIDHSGNRVAAMIYGPEKVIIIVGENKLTDNEQEGITRCLKVATPLNARRANYNPPCTRNLPCTKCKQSQRVCNYISIIRGQYESNRMIVLMLRGNYGY